ncbi:MAG: RNA methyltransferase [Bacteroidetes bacterium]|nr:RNA methyltransferase [Bacteroidota bacterium]
MRKLLNAELPRLTREQMQQQTKLPLVVVLDQVRSHLNVGSVFRTADAFLVEAIYLCGITGTPPHRDIHKTALGATETVPWKYFATTQEALQELKEKGYTLIAIEQAERATMLHDFMPTEADRYAIIFGNEVEGVSQQVVDACDVVVEIPQYGTKHSLNIAVSAGVVIWDMMAKLTGRYR